MCFQTNLGSRGFWRPGLRPDELYGAFLCSFFPSSSFSCFGETLCCCMNFESCSRVEGGDDDLIFISRWILSEWIGLKTGELRFQYSAGTLRDVDLLLWRKYLQHHRILEGWWCSNKLNWVSTEQGSVQSLSEGRIKMCKVIMSKRIKLGVRQPADLSPFMKLWHDYWSFNTPCHFLRHLSLLFFLRVWELSGLCRVSVF